MPHLFLVGYRGSGKSTVGSRLAEILNIPCYDLDQYICRKENSSIENMVRKNGWEKFRKLESIALREIVENAKTPIIMATGGGVVLSETNRNFMKSAGLVIWLDTPLEHLCERLKKSPDFANRPSLTGQGLLEEIEQVWSARKPLYQDAAHCKLNGAMDVEEICEKIAIIPEVERFLIHK